jgi:CDP-paratose 2-epimerase
MSTKHDSVRCVLIFGGAGFIGGNWAQRLLETTNAQVHVFDNLSRQGVHHNLERLKRIARGSGRLRITLGDVRDTRAVERAVATADEIYQLAAQTAVTTSVAEPRLDFEVNVCGTFNVLEAARASGRNPFVLFTSTNKVYGALADHDVVAQPKRYEFRDGRGIAEAQPLDLHSPYGCSKGAADQYVRDYARIYNLPTVVLRMSCICGPWQFGNAEQGWVAHFLYSALQGTPLVIYGDGRQMRDLLYVDDLLRAFEAVRAHSDVTRSEIYNVGGGAANAVSLLELLDLIERVTGRRPEYTFDRVRPGDQPVYVTDYSKLTRETGWRPEVSPAAALKRMYEWWKQHEALFPAAMPAVASAMTSLRELPRPA